MPATCDRHPTQPAWWQCPRCNQSLCPQCISRRASGQFNQETLYFCPKCNVATQNLELSNVITPIWGRLHKFFAYPLASWQSMGLILALSLASMIWRQPGFISILIHFAIWAVMVKYAFEALKSTASGNLHPPPLNEKVLVENFGIVFKQIALYLVLFLIFIFLVAPAGPMMIVICLILGGITLPAMLILLIINDSLGRALNPVMVIGLISRIGGHYFLLLLFLALLAGAPAALGYAFIRHLPEQLQFFTFAAAKNYYTLIGYHMMGYLILQFHNRLDYPVEMETILASLHPTDPEAAPNGSRPVAPAPNEILLNEISQLVQEGDLEKAIGQIEQQVNVGEISDIALSRQYIGLLKMCRQESKYLDYGPHHLELQVKADDKSKTLETYKECLRLDKNFTAPAVVLFKMASWLNESGKDKQAIHTFNRMIKSYPKDALVPKALYRAAQIFHERLMDAERAKKILNGLIRKYPDHDMANFARHYLNGL